MREPTIIENAFLYNADCREVLASLTDNSIDSIVTDPPYELGFMGKGWDSTGIAYDVAMWREALRVLKPGGHLLSFGGARTYHRMACAIEDAGFHIRDQIMWIYGSGFPKSHNLEGDWDGWGTALKPAHEPIVVARKPLIGTVAQNVLTHGTGALNIDACRIPLDGDYKSRPNGRPSMTGLGDNYDPANANIADTIGRWPANLIHDGSEEVVALFPQSDSKGGGGAPKSGYWGNAGEGKDAKHGDTGSAARFFYCAKVDREERNEGLKHFEAKPMNWSSGTKNPGSFQSENTNRKSPNHHPTVKPVELIRYLWRLVTPPGGTCLDLFMGSGSHGVAAILEGFDYIGCESDTEHGYFDISVARIKHATTIPQQKELFA